MNNIPSNAIIIDSEIHIPVKIANGESCIACSLLGRCAILEDCPADSIFGILYGPDSYRFEKWKGGEE